LRFGRRYFQLSVITPEKYRKFLEMRELIDKKEIEKELKEFSYRPKISVVVPVYNVELKWLNICIQSVFDQFYPNWELCLWDDSSTKVETVECLKNWNEKGDARIKIGFGQKNQHISGASNEALKLATGEFIVLLDNDDELAPSALFEVAKALNRNKKLNFIYSDEDKIDTRGRRVSPFFKPDWSPDLFFSMNYTCHLSCFRKRLVSEVGGFRLGYEGSQDYDLTLRVVEKIDERSIFHIPKVLYHWRELATSTAATPGAKKYTSDSSLKALNDYLKRNRIEGEAIEGQVPGRFYLKRAISKEKKVSIIIPFRDQVAVLRQCLNSIFKKTDYSNFELVLVNNDSQESKTEKYLADLKKNNQIKIFDYKKPFNFSAINNFAVENCEGEYVLLLNNDTEVIDSDWLTAMVREIQRPEVGVVGAKLLYPNRTIQHAGVVLGMGIAGHAFKYLPDANEGYRSQAKVLRNYSAVTGACLMTKKNLYQKVGGLDEENLKIAYNDVDFCLKIREKGYLVVYTPYAKLYHHESLSRGDDEELKKKDPERLKRVEAERRFMLEKWKEWIDNDPYYNPNLTRRREDFSLRTEKLPPKMI
jgi:GT2 family glycosyltransferase